MNDKNHQPFSVREGYEQPKSVQLEDMDDDLRNGLWNVFYHFFPNDASGPLSRAHSAFRAVWDVFLKKPTDEYRAWQTGENKVFVKNIFLSSPWYEVFDLIEFVISYLHNTDLHNPNRHRRSNAKDTFIHKCNNVLKKENSAYQVVGDLVVEITSKEEIASIKQAMDVPFAGVRKHIYRALALLSRRENPDYPNSMKESISAVEALAKEVTDNPQGTLGQLKDRLPIQHPAFKEAVSKLYGFTSDAGGIRHGGAGQPLPMDKNTARFMLIICSAFVNYIVSNDSPRK